MLGLAWAFFVSYSLFMVYLLFFGFSRSSRTEERMYNLTPFKTIVSYIEHYSLYNFDTWAINLFGNVAAFVPFGFLIPFLFRHLKGWGRITSLFVLLLFTVELLQLAFKVGSFDVDDIILNVLGGLLGFGLFRRKRGKH